MTLRLTNAGINALLRALSGDNIVFTAIKIGNGAAQSAATATDLSNPLKTITIDAISVANQKATLTVTLSNANVEAGFRMTEIGIFAQDQDDEDEEILYAYGTEPEATADYVAASGDNVLEEEISIDVFVSNVENVSALINESLVYATKAAFDAHVADKANPHEVSAVQVGLGNVPNVSTNDQTPTYTEASSNANLVSGERLTVALGKIAKAIRSMIAHLTATGNVHNATAAQIGAAPSSHSHSASDVTTGVLSVRRGGTGFGTLETNKILYPSASGSFSHLPFPTAAGQALHQGISGAPFWDYPAGSEAGTYTGDNTSGASHPNTITFKKLPKIVFIMQSGQYRRWGVLFPAAGRGFSEYDGFTGDLVVTTSDKTVSWYYNSNESHPANQLSGYFTYKYIGIY